MRRHEPFPWYDVIVWIFIVAVLLLVFVGMCEGQCCPANGQYIPTAPALVPGPLGGYRPRPVIPLVQLPRVPASNAAQVAAQSRRAIVQIISDAGDRKAIGSGVLAALQTYNGERHGIVLTCRHILASNPIVVLHDGRKFAARQAWISQEKDFAVLMFDAPQPIFCYQLSGGSLQPGARVVWVGHASSNQIRAIGGSVRGPGSDTIRIRMDNDGSPGVAGALALFRVMEGMSGGPLMSTDGRILGIVHEYTFVADTGADRSLGAVSAAWILRFLADNGLSWVAEMRHEGPLDITEEPDEPTIDPGDDTAPVIDIDIPVPNEDTEEPEEDDSELTLLIASLAANVDKLTINVNQTTTNIDKLTTRVEALELLLDPDNLDKLKGPQGDQGPAGPPGPPGEFTNNGPLTFQLLDKDGAIIQEYQAGLARFEGEVVPFQLVPVQQGN